MKCHICGAEIRAVRTDPPIQSDEQCIVIFKNLPVLQCENCSEYLLEDAVMAWVDEAMEKVSPSTELEIIRYAA
ncbi:MAG: YgiT-type zinc finger protein [Deltaproteobacteria bacterium]|nr:YgiT-type zinc finger protein [Deltaproteobacteria bacterium]